VRSYPAIEVRWPTPPDDDVVERLVAWVDEAGPTAVDPSGSSVRIYFPTASDALAAAPLARAACPDASVLPIDVPDDNWAERSQAGLGPVSVGRVVVAPPWALPARSPDGSIVVSIRPSMGFGTGHHESTRLCLLLLQRLIRPGMHALDIGTGSAVLAIAALKLGAATALGIDVDPDAIASARENVSANAIDDRLQLTTADVTTTDFGRDFDLVSANITAAMLTRHAARIAGAVGTGGLLIVSGYQTHERGEVAQAFEQLGMTTSADVEEASWVAAAFSRQA
jgi:ribosomal protein L11 methyltransferase